MKKVKWIFLIGVVIAVLFSGSMVNDYQKFKRKYPHGTIKEMRGAMREYEYQKGHSVRMYRLDVHKNYDKYVKMDTNELHEKITKESKDAVGKCYDKLFNDFGEKTALSAINDVTTRLCTYEFKTKDEFYEFCENSITAETMEVVAKQINIESLVRCGKSYKQ